MKAYNISFVFDQPQPGVMTVPGNTKEEALASFHEMMKQFSKVEVFQVIDLEDIPFLKELFDQQQNKKSFEDLEPIDDDNIVDFKKPN